MEPSGRLTRQKQFVIPWPDIEVWSFDSLAQLETRQEKSEVSMQDRELLTQTFFFHPHLSWNGFRAVEILFYVELSRNPIWSPWNIFPSPLLNTCTLPKVKRGSHIVCIELADRSTQRKTGSVFLVIWICLRISLTCADQLYRKNRWKFSFGDLWREGFSVPRGASSQQRRIEI